MDQFINSRETLVTEAIDGLVRLSGGRLARLDGHPAIKVVVRADWAADRVALVSGGGSGHEPAHAGFVGRGMLTAAVAGEVFASPSVDAVLAGILAVTGPAGCLLIVKNYTGDRLNFGLAAERARALGRDVEMVVVGDDIAIPGIAQPRGVAGTLFVHKIAGALAEAGADLATVAALARRVALETASIGMSLSTCAVPGQPPEDRIAPGMAELGLGIHGEPGVEALAWAGAEAAVATMIERLAPHLRDGPQAVIVNNLGSCTALEMGVVVEALAGHGLAARIDQVIGPAPLMTSLDMRGVSLSALALDAERAALLAAPAEPRAWPGVTGFRPPMLRPLPDGLTLAAAPPSADPARRRLIERAAAALIAAEAELNALDAKAGDGDTGSTLAGAARALAAGLDRLPLGDEAALHRALSGSLGRSMGGSSGVLLAIFFAAAGDVAAAGRTGADALVAGLARVREVGGAGPGDRTMLDALAPALEALAGGEGLPAAAAAARTGADATAAMARARAGRAAYVTAGTLSGHPDPGAEAVARVFAALAAP